MKARIKFKKYGPMIFISHLDLMRYFRKAIRRADIPVAFTKGLSPHMVMSFASPLAVGMSSDGEYFDLGLKEAISSEKAVRRLNKVMADGIQVSSFRQISEDKKMSGTARLSAADYLVRNTDLRLSEDLEEKIKGFISLPCIFAVKKTKRSEEVTDIKPLIYQMEAREKDIFLRLAAGDQSNLKPETVITAFCGSEGIPFENMGFKFRRLEMYADTNNIKGKKEFVSLEELGTEIILQ